MTARTQTLSLFAPLALALLAPLAVRPAAPAPPRTDCHGDPLPPGAVARLGTVRLRHGDGILSVAFAPSGKVVASAGSDGTVSVWETATGKELRRLRPPKGDCHLVGWDPGGKQLIVAGGRWVHRWDSGGARRNSAPVTPGLLTDWALSPDGRLVAVVGLPKEPVRVWDTLTGKQVRSFGKGRLGGHPSFSPDGKVLAVPGDRGQPCRLWDVTTGKEVRRLGKGEEETAAVAFTPDGRTFIQALTERTTIRLWDLKTGAVARRLRGYQADVWRLAVSSDGRRLAAGGAGGTVSVWDLRAGKLHCTFGGELGRVRCLAFSPDGKTLAMGGDGPALRLWDLATGKDLHPGGPHRGGVEAVAVSPDGKAVASAGQEGRIVLWDSASGRVLRLCQEQEDGVLSLAFAADGRTLVAGHYRKRGGPGYCYRVRSYSVAMGKERRRFEVRGLSGLLGVALAADARAAAFGNQDGSIQVWDVPAGRHTRTLRGPGGAVQAAFSRDGRRLVTVVDSTGLGAWNLRSGRELHYYASRTRFAIHAFACSPDGRRVAASVLEEPEVRVWDLATGRQSHALRGHKGQVLALAFSPDGKALASGGKDGTVRLWDVATGKQRRVLRGHRGGVSAVRFAPGGERLVSGGSEGTAMIWELPK